MKKEYKKVEDLIVENELETQEKCDEIAEPEQTTKIVNTPLLNVRKHNSFNSDVVKTVKENDTVVIAFENAGWGKLDDGSGWVRTEFLK